MVYLDALRRFFHLEAFRPGQCAPIQHVVDGGDAVVVMPTGSGKSLCYQLAATLLPGTTLVVSPLIALMKDQVDGLERRGIAATYINSSLEPEEMDRRLACFAHGRYKLVYIAPERLRSRAFMSLLPSVRIPLLAIDEAHCISQWGHDFRPDYLLLHQLAEQIGPHVRIMALTATATPAVREDIVQQLELGTKGRQPPLIQVQGFARPNLFLSVVHCATHIEKYERIRRLAQRGAPGIVYCATRKQAQTVYDRLRTDPALRGVVEPLLYTAALRDAERAEAQRRFLDARNPVVVATNAFGMGIDRGDIRFVAHWDIPGSPEAYYQEVGRAGRDGAPARCELLYNYADVRTQRFFLEGANPDLADAQTLLGTLRMLASEAPYACSDDELAELAGIKNVMVVRTLLGIFERAGFLERGTGGSGRDSVFVPPGAPGDGALQELFRQRSRKRAFDENRLQQMIRFAETYRCRQAFLLDYFGETGRAAACGGCDNCAPLGVARPLTEERWVTVQKVLSGIGRLKGAYSLDELIGILLGEGPEGEHPAAWGLCRGGNREELAGVLHALQAVRCFTVRSENAEGRAPVPWGALYPVLTPYGYRIARREIADFTFVWPGEIPEQQPRPGRTRAARGTGRKTGGRSRPCASRKGAPKGGNRG